LIEDKDSLMRQCSRMTPDVEEPSSADFYRVEDVKRSLGCRLTRAIAELEMRLDVVPARLESDHAVSPAEGGAVVDQKQPNTVVRNLG
jgi:hypothetical protein